MVAKKKVKNNWGKLTFYLTLIVFILGVVWAIFLYLNDLSTELYKAEIESLKSKNLELENQLDPNLTAKLNEFHTYYNYELKNRESKLMEIRMKYDSLVKQQGKIKFDKNGNVIVEREKLVKLILQLNHAEELIKGYQLELMNADSLRNIAESIISNQDMRINILKEKVSGQANFINAYRNYSTMEKVQRPLLVLLLILILILLILSSKYGDSFKLLMSRQFSRFKPKN